MLEWFTQWQAQVCKLDLHVILQRMLLLNQPKKNVNAQ
jgi:hypothetical protein